MTCAILFARAPVPGRVKTRLQAGLSPQQTAALYQAFLQDSCQLLLDCCARHKVIASADADGLDGLRSLLDPGSKAGLAFTVQQGDDLGRRMALALRAAFDEGAERAVIMGTDAPSLPPASIDEALQALTTADVVLGPVVDGGYYLVGVSKGAFEGVSPALFEAIDWSTSRVLDQSISRLPDAARLTLLPPWYDVDHPADAAFLRTHLDGLARAGDKRATYSRRALEGLVLREPPDPPAGL